MKGIYLIENLINHKCYVGQSVDIKARWKKHKISALDYSIYRAIKKYGLDNFSFVVLEEVLNEDQLTEREQYWYEVLKPEYNMIEPRQSPGKLSSKEIYQIGYNLQILKKFKSIQEASRELKIKDSHISEVCNKKTISAGGYYWSFVDDYNNWKPLRHKQLKKVLQINAETDEPLLWYDSITEAAWANNIKKQGIQLVCTGKQKTSGGYKWKYLE